MIGYLKFLWLKHGHKRLPEKYFIISVLTEIKDANKLCRTMKLNPTTEKFILHWGEMGSKWGVNRSVAQIHALLYIIGRPMNAEEICETLGMARSNVSNSIK